MNYEVRITADHCIYETYEVDADTDEQAEELALVKFEAEYGDHNGFHEFNMDPQVAS